VSIPELTPIFPPPFSFSGTEKEKGEKEKEKEKGTEKKRGCSSSSYIKDRNKIKILFSGGVKPRPLFP
jgi:hypothetical protein